MNLLVKSVSQTMKILGIETSCDETALAIVEASGGLKNPRFRVLKNLVASQIKIHRPFGGVVPNLAKREHLKNLPILLKKIENSKLKIKNCDLVAVTVGPGLEPALWTGIQFAKQLASASSQTNAEHTRTNAEKSQRKSASSPRRSAKPIRLVGTSHLEGHLYSFLLPRKAPPRGKPQKTNYQLPITNYQKIFPAIALIVSGGHTILLKVNSFAKWKKLGETRDDAVGEAFDKVARLLNLPYPGGPEIEKLARKGNPEAINFPRPMIHDKSYDFSFSGLKTSVLYYLRDNPLAKKTDIAASFQAAAIDVLVAKTIHAAKEFTAPEEGRDLAKGGGAIKSVMLSGGVAANKLLRKTLKKEIEKINSHGRVRIAGADGRRRAIRMQFFVPDFKYNLDNAAMIAAAGYFAYLRKKKHKLIAQGNLGI